MDAIVLVFVLLAGAAAEAGGETEADAGANPGDKVDPRFPAVIYQVQNRSFEDSDGIGDLRVLDVPRSLPGHVTFVVVINLGNEKTSFTLDDLISLLDWTLRVNSATLTGNSARFLLSFHRSKEEVVLTAETTTSLRFATRAGASLLLLLPLVCLYIRYGNRIMPMLPWYRKPPSLY